MSRRGAEKRAHRKPDTSLPGRGYGRLFDVLELIVSDGAGLTGTEVSRQLELPKSTVFLLLQHLRERGVLALDPTTRSYTAGQQLVQLAYRVVGGLQVVRIARPHLESLSLVTGEDAYLAVRQGTQFVYLDKVEGVQSVQLNLRLGVPRPLHATAPGKLLLAFGPAELLDEMIRERGLPAITRTTITDVDRLREELRRVRRLGYAMSTEENVPGISALAAPVRDYTGQVVAVVNIPTQRARATARRELLVKHAMRASEEISRALGWDGGKCA